jgi:hypothetical protein
MNINICQGQTELVERNSGEKQVVKLPFGSILNLTLMFLKRAVLELADFFPVETITNRLSMPENTQKQNFRSLVPLGHILQASQKFKIGPKWYFIWDYGKLKSKWLIF